MKLAAAAAALWIMRMTSLNLARSPSFGRWVNPIRGTNDRESQNHGSISRNSLVPACMVFFITGRKYIRKIPNHWLNPKRSYLIFSADLFFLGRKKRIQYRNRNVILFFLPTVFSIGCYSSRLREKGKKALDLSRSISFRGAPDRRRRYRWARRGTWKRNSTSMPRPDGAVMDLRQVSVKVCALITL